MPILRHNHEQEFTILPNSLIRNPELSLRDVGLLCYILSLPPDWEFSVNGLDVIIQKNGASSVRAGVRALEKADYLRRTQIRWTVSDIPLEQLPDAYPVVENPLVENQLVDNQLVENRRQTKNISNKVNTNKEKREQKAPSIPVLQDVKAYIQENGLSVNAEQFYDYYTARGWMLSGTQIVDWTALLRNWERRERKEGVLYGTQNGCSQHGANGLELPWKLCTEL